MELKLGEKKVEIELGWQWGAAAKCPECGRACSIHDCAPERTWRHLDTMQFTTLIRARAPRSDCPKHGRRGEVDSRSPQRIGHQPCALDVEINHQNNGDQAAADAFNRHNVKPAPVPRQQTQNCGKKNDSEQSAHPPKNRRSAGACSTCARQK